MSNWWGSFVIGSYAYRAEKMLVTRMQDHMITTADGSIHCIVNMGMGKGLVVLTSTDGGETYNQSQLIFNTTFHSTSDVVLLSDGMTTVTTYVTDSGELMVSVQTYDPETQDWDLVALSTLPTGYLSAYAVNPSLAASPGGKIFVSYTASDPLGTELTLCFSDDMGETWTTSTILLWGEYSGSSCMVTTDTLVGAIVATNSYVLWVNVDEEGQMTQSVISLEGVAGNFASHFSAASFGSSIYLTMVTEDHELAFFRYNPLKQDWIKYASPIDPHLEVRWVQTSVSEDGTVYLLYDDEEQGKIIVLESSDGGKTWVKEAGLLLPEYALDDDFRFETSETTVGDMEVMVQLDLGSTANGIYTYVVDVDDNGFDAPSETPPIDTGVDYFTF